MDFAFYLLESLSSVSFENTLARVLTAAATAHQCAGAVGVDLTDLDIVPDSPADEEFSALAECAFSVVAGLSSPEKAVGAIYDLFEQQLIQLDTAAQIELGSALAERAHGIGEKIRGALKVVDLSRGLSLLHDQWVNILLGGSRATIALAPKPTVERDECNPGVLRRDIGPEAYVIDEACQGGWAYVGRCTAPEECGDHEVIARYRGGRWEIVVGFPTTTCRSDLAEQGAPPLVLDQVNWPCDRAGEGLATSADNPVLSRGDKGQRVRALQGVLVARQLLSPPVDGTFGPATEKAVKRFQAASGLAADGIAGPATQGALGLQRDPATGLDPWTTYALNGLDVSTLELTLMQWEYAGADLKDWLVGDEFVHMVASDCTVYAMDGTTRTLDRLAEFIDEIGATDFPPVFQLLTGGRGEVTTIIQAA
jgi:peptidoglycan hydrolase-like protein with peptidoglycan-binding domain